MLFGVLMAGQPLVVVMVGSIGIFSVPCVLSWELKVCCLGTNWL